MSDSNISKHIQFVNDLISFDIQPYDYLRIARSNAKRYGLNPKLLSFSIDGKHKLDYDGIQFGRVGYNDYIIYSTLAKQGIISKAEAKQHRDRYLARATNIKGNWKDNILSKNNLSQNILW